MWANLSIVARVSGVQSIPLETHSDHLFLIDDLVFIHVAAGSHLTQAVLFDIKDECVLPHEGAAEQDLIRSAEALDSHAVLVRFFSVEVLAWVPL